MAVFEIARFKINPEHAQSLLDSRDAMVQAIEAKVPCPRRGPVGATRRFDVDRCLEMAGSGISRDGRC